MIIYPLIIKKMATQTNTHAVTAPQAADETLSARDRIKPRGLAGLFKGRIHYDENADIFNLN
ncbi:hypothetical protein AGMMS4956_05950 [Bacteroidia bacterium]|nr:hypothetical protein AGMMS4956_05950 [Bacteroidia bacterium]